MLQNRSILKKIGALFAAAVFLSSAACKGPVDVFSLPTEITARSPSPVAENPRNLHVATYNIKHGSMVGYDFSLIGQKIAELDIDIIGLQEVENKTERVGYQDVLQELSQTSGCPYYAFAKAIDFEEGEYGLAVLSRYEIIRFDTILLYSEGTEQRVLGHAVICVGDQLIDFFVTHLTFGKNTNIRKKQLEGIAQELARTEQYIITGDFNTSDYQEFELFDGATPLNNFDQYFETFYPYELGPDNIIFSCAWKSLSVQMENFEYSDHYMLHAVVEREDNDA